MTSTRLALLPVAQLDAILRISDKILVGNDCWEWTAYLFPDGYGGVSWGGKLHRAHRFVYEIFKGSIPAGLTLDHLCRNKKCVKPSHLEPVTSRENTLRGQTLAAAEAARTHCPRGHEYSLENTYVSSRRKRFCRTCHRASWITTGRYRRIAHRWDNAT